MADEETVGGDEIKATDIVFDCPFCGKSLAIDYRGAGLSIDCTDCGKRVEVPIPEGMELGDFDRTAEEQEINIIHLRKALTTAEGRIDSLQKEIDELQDQRRTLDEYRTSSTYRFNGIMEKIAVVEQATRMLNETVGDVVLLAREGAGVEVALPVAASDSESDTDADSDADSDE